MMNEGLKILGKLFFLTLLLVHFALITLFFAPTSLLVSKVYQEVKLIELQDVPVVVSETLKENNLILSTVFDHKTNWTDRLFVTILEFRYKYFMEEDEKLAFNLSVLDFGEGVVGIQAASEYYFKVPLSQISENNWLTLVQLHQIFLK